MDDEIDALIEAMGKACSGYEMSAVLTALTYLVADACIQSGLGEDVFLTRFNKVLVETITDLEGFSDGNCTHH